MPIFLHNIGLSYKNKPLFKNFNLELPDHKCICLLGPSGVGKTTLLRLIAGLETNTEPGAASKIVYEGSISYMAQQDLLLPWLNVLDNVLLGYRLRKTITKTLKQQAIDLLAKVGLEQVAKQLPMTLSSGMRQRVAVARTLLENRSIILMDEPFSALDAITRLRLQNLVATMFIKRTVLLVTHDPLEALRLADIIYVLSSSPVTISEPMTPEGSAPRDPTDSKLLKLQAELLAKLLSAHGANNDNY